MSLKGEKVIEASRRPGQILLSINSTPMSDREFDRMLQHQHNDLTCSLCGAQDACSHVQDALLRNPNLESESSRTGATIHEEFAPRPQGTESFSTGHLVRKLSARFSKDNVKVLKAWLLEHAEHPYPDEEAMKELRDMTGLQRVQISNWLANARRRYKVRRPLDPLPHSDAIAIPGQRDQSHLGPMDRWRASPPEHEPASIGDIARAMTNQQMPLSSHDTSSTSLPELGAESHRHTSGDHANWTVFRAPSESSCDSQASSRSSVSHTSTKSLDSRRVSSSARNRQKRRKDLKASKADIQNGVRRFQCTFCTVSFHTKYDWQRHEKSLHLALEQWICCPSGGVVEVDGVQRCVFCPQVDPPAGHLNDHNYKECNARPEQQRSFYRKDHLTQHLKQTHNAVFNPFMNSWKKALTEIRSRCGFCSSTFMTWQQRVDHLAAHFAKTTDMSSWSDGWGFEPHIEASVQNAIPPYMIAHDRFTMNPYAAPPRGEPADTTLQVNYDALPDLYASEVRDLADTSNWVDKARASLIKLVSEQRAVGLVPTDRQLQDHARMIIYGDPDPLDWTIADNETWLNAFKYQMGIDSVSNSASPQLTQNTPISGPNVVKDGSEPIEQTMTMFAKDLHTATMNTAAVFDGPENILFNTESLNLDTLDFNTFDFDGLKFDGIEDSVFEIGGFTDSIHDVVDQDKFGHL